MQSGSRKVVAAAVWVSLVGLAGVAFHLNSWASWAEFVAIAIVPVLVMMRLWKDPAETMSQSIQQGRR